MQTLRLVRECFGSLFVVSLGVCALGGAARAADNYTNIDALNILTQDDGGFCRPQAGSWWPAYYNAGCCGSPGNRVCARVLHAGKGSWGISAGCTDPDQNLNSSSICNLPSVQPMSIPGDMPTARPNTGTDIWFLITSDLHFYRDWYNVSDQAAHPYTMNQFADAEARAGHPYKATLILGDMTTGPDRERLASYRLLWEKEWLPGASMKLPTFPTLGNHDSSTTDQDDARTMWYYLVGLTLNSRLHVDRNHTGCLVGVDAGCLDELGFGGSLNYSWDWQGVHMVMLNTWAGDKDNAYQPPLGSNGMVWLRKDLAYYVGNTRRPVMIFQHYGIDDNSSVDTKHSWWTLQNVTDFENLLANYNVIGWFSGHTHSLGKQDAPNKVNVNNGAGNGVGQILDNLVDGAGGDCQHHGDGNTNEDSLYPWKSTYCAGATANFFAVHVTDSTMTVRTISYNNSKGVAPYDDSSIGLVGTGSTSSQSGCVKRFGDFREITNLAQISPGASSITVRNTSGATISGALAVMVESGLSSWDFTDSCISYSAHKFVMVTNGSLAAGASMSVNYSGADLTGLHLYQLNDSLVLSQNSVVVGTQPVTVTLSTTSGRSVPFTYQTTVIPCCQSIPVQVTVDQSHTPAQLTVNASAVQVGAGLISVVITAQDSTIPPIALTVTLNAPLSITSAEPGAQASYYDNLAGLGGFWIPFNLPIDQQTYPGYTMKLDVPTPQYPSTGTRYDFNGWSDGGAKQHTVTVPLGGLNLSVNFNTSYLITTTVSPGGAMETNPPGSNGYYRAGSSVTVIAKANSGYRFTGFTGALSGTKVPQTLTVTSPLTIGATFSNTVNVTITSQPANGVIYVDNVAYIGSNTFQWVIGSRHALDASKTDDGGGTHQAFKSWSAGGQPSKFTYVVPDADATITGSFDMSYLLTLNADTGGTLTASPVSADGYYLAGTPVTVTAAPAAKYYLSGFSVGASSATSPQTVTMSQPRTVAATFTADPVTSFSTSNDPLTILVDGVAVQTPAQFYWVPGSSHTVGISSPQAGGTGVRYIFVRWSDGSTVASRSIVAGAANASYQLVTATQFRVTAEANPAEGGTVGGGGWYTQGTQAAITATAAGGFIFNGFSGDVPSNSAPDTFTVKSPVRIVANFTEQEDSHE